MWFDFEQRTIPDISQASVQFPLRAIQEDRYAVASSYSSNIGGFKGSPAQSDDLNAS
jgi:hypothetical protein